MKFCYADPPYPGQAKKHYADDPRCAEVDHAALLRSLCTDYPDGWALSTSSVALQHVMECARAAGLSQENGDFRVGAWVKPFCAFKVNVNPAYAWEPVIFTGGRKRPRTEDTVRDYVSESITLLRGTHGAKPEAFCWWLFDLWGAQAGDELVDMFPGSGAVMRAWNAFRHERLFVA